MSAEFVDGGDSFSVQLAGLPQDTRRRIVDYLDRQVELGLLVPVPREVDA